MSIMPDQMLAITTVRQVSSQLLPIACSLDAFGAQGTRVEARCGLGAVLQSQHASDNVLVSFYGV